MGWARGAGHKDVALAAPRAQPACVSSRSSSAEQSKMLRASLVRCGAAAGWAPTPRVEPLTPDVGTDEVEEVP